MNIPAIDLARNVAGVATKVAKQEMDADRWLMRSMATLIGVAGQRYAWDPGAQYKAGQPLKLLLAGYSGTRNTGADVRVEEMIRQFRHLLGDDHLSLSILTMDPELTRGYFRTVHQLHMPRVFPKYIFDRVHEHHGVIACEGSMFKSKFANALSTLMVGALGVASAEHKLSVGYGGEAGNMDPMLQSLVQKYCADSLLIVRNEQSQVVLKELGLRSTPGTDTAWTFDPAPPGVGQQILRDAGWDGKTKILAVAPINGFWWPVKPDLGKTFERFALKRHLDSHYASIYFHNSGPEVHRKQKRYIQCLASAVRRFREKHSCFVVAIGMEQLDRSACEAFAAELGGDVPVLASDRLDMYQMVSVLRQSRWLVSSRYHAVVTSMPTGVASVGVTMDERIANLMADRGQAELSLHIEQEGLDEALYENLEKIERERDQVQDGIYRCVVKNLRRMAQMGVVFVEHLRQHYPEFPLRSGVGEGQELWSHLPVLPGAVEEIVREYGGV